MTTLRPATAADVPALHAMLVENAENDHGHLRGTEETLRRWGFGPAPLFRCVIAEDADGPLGLSLFFPEYSSWRGRIGVYVQDLYVRPRARGRGLGRALLSESLRVAADWDPAFLTLIVHHANADAQAFYARLGFTLRERADLLVCEGAALTRLAP